jgi:hypothetical protein
MLTRKTQRQRSNDWHDYYSRQALERANVNGDKPFVYVGMGLEPERAWNDKSHKYDGPIIGQGVWVVQNVDGYKQNPIKVIVETDSISGLNFGKSVQFQGLLGYFSRKNYSYSFRADGIKVLD